MLFFIFRVSSAIIAFLYPGYASYKTLSQRPASEEDLERWLMYWSVLGCIVGVEYVAEWAIKWIPFYYTLKTLFIFYLALPQTAGSSYLYVTFLAPFFKSHESEIDSALARLKNTAYNYVQKIARNAWSQVVAPATGQQPAQMVPDALDEGGLTGEAAVHSGAPPTLSDPISGPLQLAQTFWSSYGPLLVASGTGFLRQAQASSQAQAAQALETPSPSRFNSSSVIHDRNERRRQLEAELARLEREGGGEGAGASVQGYDLTSSPVLVPVANSPHSRTASSTSLLRERNHSSGSGRYEEVEVPSDIESEGLMSPTSPTMRLPQERQSSWFR